jgi:[acyl-carrier-protein] S-malonyltransferase
VTTAFVFPGQGSQSPQIGVPWRAHPSWGVVEEASDSTGVDVGRLLCDAEGDELLDTANAQLSTYVVSVMIGRALGATGVEPQHVAGHSLGEYSALTVAGWLSLADGARLVSSRGLAMREASAATPGTMAAVIGLEPDALVTLCGSVDGDVWVANDNAPGQVVIAGTAAAIEMVGALAKEGGARSPIALKVAGAFHTPFMANAQEGLDRALAQAPFTRGGATPWANVDARAHDDEGEWPGLLSAQLCSVVRWRQLVTGLASTGVEQVVEVGPGAVLSGMVKRIAPVLGRQQCSTPEQVEAVAAQLR